MNKDLGNPLLAAMPKMLAPQELTREIQSLPPLPAAPSLEGLALLSSIFIPMDYMYALYDQLYRAIRTTYTTRTVLEGIRQTNALFRGDAGIRGDAGTCFATQAAAGSVLGVPGIGKTSTIRRCLDTMPQVIEHTDFEGQPFFCKQVLYLRVECPSDCSVKTLALNLVAALDRAIGSNYLHQLTALRSAAASAIAAQVKILCMTHHVGLILVDEIQNAVVTAQKNKQVKPLIKFLVELTNDTCTGVFFVGTPQAEELFTSQEHLKRRTRGIRLLPLKPDGVYRNFLKLLWRYQLTPERAELTEALANKLYDWSGGIPAYIVKIFQESQAQAFLMGRPCIDAKIMQQAINILAIKVPKTYAGGTYLSDFPPIGFQPIQPAEENCKSLAGLMADCKQADYKKAGCKPAQERKRLYAKKRGRKAAVREEQDLLAAFKAGADMLEHLSKFNLLVKESEDENGASEDG